MNVKERKWKDRGASTISGVKKRKKRTLFGWTQNFCLYLLFCFRNFFFIHGRRGEGAMEGRRKKYFLVEPGTFVFLLCFWNFFYFKVGERGERTERGAREKHQWRGKEESISRWKMLSRMAMKRRFHFLFPFQRFKQFPFLLSRGKKWKLEMEAEKKWKKWTETHWKRFLWKNISSPTAFFIFFSVYFCCPHIKPVPRRRKKDWE